MLIIPYEVDVPFDRRPVANWLLIVSILLVFGLQIAAAFDAEAAAAFARIYGAATINGQPVVRQASHPVVDQLHFLPRVQVKVGSRRLDPFGWLAKCFVQQVVGRDQVVVDRVAQMWQVNAAKGTVPITAVALASIKFTAG